MKNAAVADTTAAGQIEKCVARTSTSSTSSAVTAQAPSRNRQWWQAEAARVGSDWRGVISLHWSVFRRLADAHGSVINSTAT